jgi:hypothetical protein
MIAPERRIAACVALTFLPSLDDIRFYFEQVK